MTKLTLLLTFIFLILAACSSAPGELSLDQAITSDNPALQELENTSEVENPPAGDTSDLPAQPSIPSQFQTIYIDPAQVKVIGSEMVEWQDSCLGIEQVGVECIPGNIPGYAVMLEAKGLKFAFHSDEVGSQVQPATPGLIWTRDDSDEAICDRLVIFWDASTRSPPVSCGWMHSVSVNLQERCWRKYPLRERARLTTFSENTVNQPSPEQQNPVMVSLTFHGQGDTFPNADQQESLVLMAELIFDRIIP